MATRLSRGRAPAASFLGVRPSQSFAVWLLAIVAAGVVCCAGMASERPQMPFTGFAGPVIIGHRGGALEAPENTLAAVAHSKRVGADWVELDVRLSADGVPVIIHDARLERTTSGQGEVAASKVSKLTKLAAGSPSLEPQLLAALQGRGIVPPRFSVEGERLPLLSEVLRESEIRFMLELKGSNREPREFVRIVVETIYDAYATERVAIGSFDPALLWAAHERDPSLPLIGIVETVEQLNAMLNLPVAILAVPVALVEQAQNLVQAQTALWVWTVYDVETAQQLVKAKVHGIITDVPQQIVAALRPEPSIYVDGIEP